MTQYFGAQHDLPALIKTHLFLLCPNNCGSSFLIGAIGEAQQVWSLRREGQHVPGFSGPNTRNTNLPLIWGANEDRRAKFTDASRYDWAKTKRAWYFQATANDPGASVFATKAPPFLLIPDLLDQNFHNTKFILMLRNPYAMAEGIIRRYPSSPEMTAEIAHHVVNCFKKQADNIDALSAQSVFLKYEDMCAEPKGTLQRLQCHVPELSDLRFDQPIAVKGLYHQPVTDFNDRQIARLTGDQIRQLNLIFEAEAALFARFGYDHISA